MRRGVAETDADCSCACEECGIIHVWLTSRGVAVRLFHCVAVSVTCQLHVSYVSVTCLVNVAQCLSADEMCQYRALIATLLTKTSIQDG